MNVPEHGHCEICQIPVVRGERFCGSEECEEKHKANVREKKRQVLILLLVIGASVVLVALGRI